MKKFLLLMVVIIGLTISSNAQTKFGVKAALNISNFSGDDFDDLDSRTAAAFGVFAQISINDKLTFQPELLYSMQGAESSYSESGYESEDKIKVDYLQIPLLMKYYVIEGLSINAGPQIGFLLSAKDDWEYNYDEGSEEGEEDIKDYFKSMDFGLAFGLGYELQSGLGFDFRYNLGLSNIVEEDEMGMDAEGKNSVIQFAVIFAF
jgi:hypothetical protein